MNQQHAHASTFFALVERMKYLKRWSLMRTHHEESLAEHTFDVVAIVHLLALIARHRYQRDLDLEYMLTRALYHDVAEIITGDLPTPVKYFDNKIHKAYVHVEQAALEAIQDQLPEDIREPFNLCLIQSSDIHAYEDRLIKAADKLSAYVFCLIETKAANKDFEQAQETLRASVEACAQDLPEVADFVRDFIPSCGSSLDTLIKTPSHTRL